MNNILKEHLFPVESFIAGWYIDESLCDDIITYFKNNQSFHNQGSFHLYGVNQINSNIKESTDLKIKNTDFFYPFNDYRNYIQIIIENYQKKYKELETGSRFSVIEDYNIQYYKPNQGFKIWHSERTFDVSNRMLVFMTYLNDVPDGGTEFKYQKIISPAKKGLTLVWPSDFTHTHRGQISKIKEKYIVTGWLNFYE
jgi:prolyl 4-hydroxylase